MNAPPTDSLLMERPAPRALDNPVIGKKRLRIVHVVISLKVGGMEQFILRIAAAQRGAGHDASIVSLQSGDLVEDARRAGIPVRVLGGRIKIFRVLRGLVLLGRLRADIIHAHNLSSLHYAVLGKLVGRPRLVMTNHGQGLGSARVPHARELRQTDAIIAVSQAVATRLESPEVAGKVQVITNGIQVDAPSRPRQSVRADLGLNERIAGIIVARIDKLKGHEPLVRATAKLRDVGVPFTLLVAGDGIEREPMERLASELALGPQHIRFLGFRSDVPDLLAASDIFLLPSVTEGLPLSMLEAMSHSLPIVATPVGGIPELIEDEKHGFLVPVGDVDRLAEAIACLVGDGRLRERLGLAAFERVTSDFSFDVMTGRYQELYEQLLSARR